MYMYVCMYIYIHIYTYIHVYGPDVGAHIYMTLSGLQEQKTMSWFVVAHLRVSYISERYRYPISHIYDTGISLIYRTGILYE